MRDHEGQALAYVYYEDEPGRQVAHERRGAKDCSEYRQAAGVFAKVGKRLTIKRLTIKTRGKATGGVTRSITYHLINSERDRRRVRIGFGNLTEGD